ncbi:unnamed protein product [Rotaria socialis]|uniref:Uncharacterized protein n=1 Tax=Rotaria socialis TaxID=392032 RepID=A0A817TH64_9BILA|nr:unnamed protein product [Rotaria socialis]CAF3315403.1 unnamed protein product [Rotaria socialis]CAF3725885.1 unnamed protein product [Rotaria socialis]
MAEMNTWNESLFGCCDDFPICCFGCCCTPCLFGSNAEKIDDSSCLGFCCIYWLLAHFYMCWLPHYLKREKLRRIYNLREDATCSDIPATLCCGPCALCQEAREMKSRGHNGRSNQQMSYQVTNQPTFSQPIYSRPPPQEAYESRHF